MKIQLAFLFLLVGCSTPLPQPAGAKQPVFVVSAFCNERCRWLPTILQADSAVFTSTDAALAQARSWATQSGVSQFVIDTMLSSWDAGQDMDVELRLDDGKYLDLLLYTDDIQP